MEGRLAEPGFVVTRAAVLAERSAMHVGVAGGTRVGPGLHLQGRLRVASGALDRRVPPAQREGGVGVVVHRARSPRGGSVAGGANHWQCNFQAGVQVSSMDEFRVIAVGN